MSTTMERLNTAYHMYPPDWYELMYTYNSWYLYIRYAMAK